VAVLKVQHLERTGPRLLHERVPLMARDYPAEMTALIEESTQGSDWVPAPRS
jgi:hypothetical protein